MIIVFAIRKLKYRKSDRFEDRLKPIDFSPGQDGHDDDFIEKTLYRTASTASADRQRQQFVKELETDPNYIAGIPEHDFTAAPNHSAYGTYDDMYTNDPFAHAQSYHYNEHIAYPPTAHVDYPTQDTDGYADLQRGNSVGSGSGHGHDTAHAYGAPAPTTGAYYPPDEYMGQPTAGHAVEGPYAQAATFRAY